MPSPVLIIPILHALLRKRPPPEISENPTFGASGQAEQGECKPSVSQVENSGNSPSVWTRTMDYLWEEDETAKGEYIPNYRWTPILSGIIIPFAILLEIPGLTEHWYIRTVENKTVETQENPKILDAALAISMISAVVANVALIVRFLERRVRLATFIAIGGLVIHDIINIVAVTIFGVVHAVDDGFTYGQAFWMTVCSTIASIITTVSLVWDWVQTPDFGRSGSGLSRKQRSLVIIVMVLLCYIALGALCYSFIIGISFQNGLYFTVVSIETVGFGDIILTTTLGRIFSIFYNTFGIINLGLAVNTTRETIIESFENSYRKRRAQRDKHKHERAQIQVAEQMLQRMGVPVYVPPPATTASGQQASEKIVPAHPKVDSGMGGISQSAWSVIPDLGWGHEEQQERMVLNVWALSQEQRRVLFGNPSMNESSTAMGLGVGVAANVGAMVCAGAGGSTLGEKGSILESPVTSTSSGASTHPSRPAASDLDPATLIERFHAELGGAAHEKESADYTTLQEKLEKEERREFTVKLSIAWSLFAAFWLIGSGVFMATEGWAFGSSMFFCFCTFSTVGYGDFAPKSPAGRAFFVVWALFGIAAMTILISVLTEAYSSRYKTAIHSGILDRALKSIHSQRRRPHSHSHHHHTSSAPDPNALAIEIINNARAIREHMTWFINSSGTKGAPESVMKVLDDIAEGENMNKGVKKDFMSNDEARKTVFIMSFERMLHNLACAAEDAARMPQARTGDDSNGEPHTT